MRFYFLEEAEREFLHQVDYYESERVGLGLEYAEEVYSAIQRICEFPDAWPVVSRRTRRCLVHRFPFGVIYRNLHGVIEVVAVADLRRRPNYWQDRQPMG